MAGVEVSFHTCPDNESYPSAFSLLSLSFATFVFQTCDHSCVPSTALNSLLYFSVFDVQIAIRTKKSSCAFTNHRQQGNDISRFCVGVLLTQSIALKACLHTP